MMGKKEFSEVVPTGAGAARLEFAGNWFIDAGILGSEDTTEGVNN